MGDEEEAMVVLAIEYEVPDFAGWKQIFDKDPMGRASHGVTRHWIHQDADNPNHVMLSMEFGSADQARSFLDEPAFQQVWDRSGAMGPRPSPSSGTPTTARRPVRLRSPSKPGEAYSDVVVQGTVKFWRDDDGWGVIASPAVPDDVWAHFSAIEAVGYRALAQGDPVEFDCQPAEQDGYHFLATRVRKLQ